MNRRFELPTRKQNVEFQLCLAHHRCKLHTGSVWWRASKHIEGQQVA
jgi:hypothetical protein